MHRVGVAGPVVVAALVGGCAGSGGGEQLGASGSPTAAPVTSSAVQVVADCRAGGVRPESIITACADAGRMLLDIDYSAWGAEQATGTTRVVIKHGEGLGSYDAHFALIEPKLWHGQSYFSRAVIDFDGKPPAPGESRIVINLESTWIVADIIREDTEADPPDSTD